MKVYILIHINTLDIMGVFENKEIADKWCSAVGYSVVREYEVRNA